MKYTIEQFRKDYPNDAVCLDKIFKLRYGKLECCPNCAVTPAVFRRITTRRAYQCRDCYHQLYPTAGTVFEKSRTPLTFWFYAMYMMSVTRNGVSAKELQRCLGVTYKTAWRMAKCLRELMGRKKKKNLRGRTIEMDETYFGKSSGTGRSKPEGKNAGIVFGMVERMGSVILEKVESVQKAEIFKIITDSVSKTSRIMTDEFPLYTNLHKEGYESHYRIRHAMKKYVVGQVSTNTIEGVFSHLKRMIKGTHMWVSGKYLHLYCDEVAFRYNHRKNPGGMFEIFISSLE